MKKAAGIIPARYQSRRFPGKPLAPICGKPMLQHVFSRAEKSRLLKKIIIATDDDRIREAARGFGAEAVMTSPHHRSGTERVAEAAEDLDFDIIINIQGDEPLLNPDWVDRLVKTLQNETIPMATLRFPGTGPEEFFSRNIVKLVVDRREHALYFSRSPIPFQSHSDYWIHIGIYGFQKKFLKTFTRLAPGALEKKENLEQLRALENGYVIKTILAREPGLSVDVPQDIIKVEKKLESDMKEDG